MGRKPSGDVPPWMDLKEALEITKEIYETGGGSVGLDDLASMMQHTAKSSSFRMKMIALRAFGLAQADSQTVSLTPLGSATAAPSSNEEYRDAVLKAFNAIPLHRSLHQKYKGGYLPEDTFLANTLHREFNVSSEQREKWVECFKQSGRVAGILRDEGGKVRVLQNPIPNGGYAMHPETKEVPIPKEEISEKRVTERIAQQQTPDSFPVFLDEERSVIVPVKFDAEDLEYLRGVLDLYVKRRKSKKE